RAARRVQLRGGARRPGARRSLSTLSAPGEGANEADGPLSASAGRVEDGGESREQDAEQPDRQRARELVAGGFGAGDVGGEVAEEAVVDLEDEGGRAVDDARLDEAPAGG